MTDAQHTQEKEALEDCANRLLVVEGVNLGALAFTESGTWTTKDGGIVTGPGYTVAFTPSADCTAAMRLLHAAIPTPPVTPPDPPTTPPVVVPPTTTPIPPPSTTPVPPPATSMAGKPVTITGTLADDTAINVTLKPGDIVPIAPGACAVYYADGMCVLIENGYETTTGDLSGHFAITVDGTTLFDGDLTIPPRTATRPFWLAAPQVRPDADLSLFPTFGKQAANASWAAKYHTADAGTHPQDNGPTGIGPILTAIGTGGEHDYLGALPEWDAIYCCNPTPENADIVRAMSDAVAPQPMRVRDSKTGKFLRIGDYPHASVVPELQTVAYPENPVQRCTTTSVVSLGQGTTHAPAWCALACELFGTDYDREQLAFWANYEAALDGSWVYAAPTGCRLFQNAQRGVGRGLVELLYATKYSCDTAYFQAMVDELPGEMVKRWINGQTGIGIMQYSGGYPHDEYAPWGQDFLTYAVGLAIQHGNAAYQPVLDYFASATCDRMLAAQPELGTIYSAAYLRAQRPDEAAATQSACNAVLAYFDTLTETYAQTYIDKLTAFVAASSFDLRTKNLLTPVVNSAVRASLDGSKVVATTLHTQLAAQSAAAYVPVDDWADGLQAKAIYDAKTAAALACATGGQALQDAMGQGNKPGDFSGYPVDPTGYAAMYQPALAICVDYGTDKARAAAAWAMYVEHARQDYSANPKYDVVPRTA